LIRAIDRSLRGPGAAQALGEPGTVNRRHDEGSFDLERCDPPAEVESSVVLVITRVEDEYLGKLQVSAAH
jgi:hypothetical protein